MAEILWIECRTAKRGELGRRRFEDYHSRAFYNKFDGVVAIGRES